MRVTDVYREALRFNSDKQALLEGAHPNEIIAILDSCIARLNNATSAEEVTRLAKEIDVRTDAWAKIRGATRPARQNFGSREEYNEAVASYNNLTAETENKIKEAGEALERKKGEFDIRAPKPSPQKTRKRGARGKDVLADTSPEDENKPGQEGTISSPDEPSPFDSIVPSYRGKFVADDLIPIWSEMTYLQLLSKEEPALQKAKEEWEKKANLAEPEKGTDEHNQWATVKEEGTAFWEDAATIRELVCDDKQKLLWKAENDKSPFPDKNTVSNIGTPNAKNPVVEWKDSEGNIYKVSSAGGTSGSMILECPDKTKFIMKRGGKVKDMRLKNECAADEFYRACGVRVPESRLYSDSQGHLVKLSRFIENVTPLDDWLKDHESDTDATNLMREKLREHFAVDVLIGNWDVVGGWGKNIVVDQNGDPWRVDNGSAFSNPPDEKKKPPKSADEWGAVDGDKVEAFVDDLWTMTGNGERIGKANRGELTNTFGNYDVLEIADQIDALQGTDDLTNALDALGKVSPDDRKIIEKRLKEVHQLSVRGDESVETGYTRSFALDMLDDSYVCSKEGFREMCQFEVDLKNGHFGWFRMGGTYQEAQFPEKEEVEQAFLAVQTTYRYNRDKKKDKKLSPQALAKSTVVKTALGFEEVLRQAVNAGSSTAQNYLDWLAGVKQAAEEGLYCPELEIKKLSTPPRELQGLGANYDNACDYLYAKLDELPSPLETGKKPSEIDFDTIQTHSGSAYGNGGSYVKNENTQESVSRNKASACDPKILELRALGMDVRQYESAEAFWKEASRKAFLGTETEHFTKRNQRKNCLESIKKFMGIPIEDVDPQDYDKRYRMHVRKQALITLTLENVKFSGNDSANRTVRVIRTDEYKIFKGDNTNDLQPGDICNIRTDPTGSASLTGAYVAGQKTDPAAIVADVPYSHVKDIFFFSPTEGKSRFIGGDLEGEVIVNLNGVDVYFVGKLPKSDGKKTSSYVAKSAEEINKELENIKRRKKSS